MDVRLFRISSGEDIIAEVVESNDDVLTIKNGIVAIPNGKSMQIGFAPWTPLLDPDTEIVIEKSWVVYDATPSSAVLEHYNGMFGNVMVPENKIIV